MTRSRNKLRKTLEDNSIEEKSRKRGKAFCSGAAGIALVGLLVAGIGNQASNRKLSGRLSIESEQITVSIVRPSRALRRFQSN
jgi:hypothetical protein